jgi:hypothetical protein
MSLKSYVSIRSFITSDKLETFLKTKGQFNGVSEFTDYVLKPVNKKSINTDKNLMWCREIHQNARPPMKIGKFYPFYKKNITFKAGLPLCEIPIGSPHIECDGLNRAKKCLGKDLEVWFKFKRITRYYTYEDITIYIEDVEYIGISVDIVCRNESNTLKENERIVRDFMKEHDVTKVIPHQVATLVAKALKKV